MAEQLSNVQPQAELSRDDPGGDSLPIAIVTDVGIGTRLPLWATSCSNSISNNSLLGPTIASAPFFRGSDARRMGWFRGGRSAYGLAGTVGSAPGMRARASAAGTAASRLVAWPVPAQNWARRPLRSAHHRPLTFRAASIAPLFSK